MDVEIYVSTSPTAGVTGSPIATITNPASGMVSYSFTTGSTINYVRINLKKNSTESTSYNIDNLQISTVAPYVAMIVMTSDYYPYGYQMPGRHTNDPNYRFGYNGMEKNAEMYGEGNEYSTEFRQYDPRLGRWMSLDPLMAKYPSMSPYVAFNDNPVYFTDPLGLEGEKPKREEGRARASRLESREARARRKHERKNNKMDEVVIKPAEYQRKYIGIRRPKPTESRVIANAITKRVIDNLRKFGEAGDKLVKGNSRFIDDFWVGHETVNKGGGIDWRKNDGSDYSSDDWNHFTSKDAEIEILPFLPGSIAGGSEPGVNKYKQKENWTSKPKDFLEKGSDHPVTRGVESVDKGMDAYGKKKPTSKDIYARVKYWSSYPSTSSTTTAYFKTEKEMKEQFPNANWNEDYNRWEIGMDAPISLKKASSLDF